MAPDEGRRSDHETRDVDVRGVAKVVLWIVVVVAVVHVALWFLYLGFGETAPGEAVLRSEPDRSRARGPALEIAPRREAEAVRRAQEELLQSYGWVDREKGLVRIPIDRAMDLYLEARRREEER